jgi:hypothetical protein
MSVRLLSRPSRPSSISMMSLRDYVKHFCNARNDILHIQDIEIINPFCDGINNVKTVEEIGMKKAKTVARLLESRGKGPSRKRDDWEVNTTK